MYCDLYAELVDVALVVAVADPVTELAETRAAAMSEAYAAEAHAARHAALDTGDRAARERLQRRAQAATAAAAAQIHRYRDHEHLLREAEVDALVVLTAPPVRREPTVAAAQAGKHVFIQGPMATNLAAADAMAAAVRAAGVQFHSQCGARYPRDMVLARRAVESGALGAMGSARVELNWFRGQGYYRRWHGTWDGEGGGAAFHHGRYIIDPFLWVVGSPVVELFAYAGPKLRRIETECLTQAVLQFANGAGGALHASLLNHKQPLTPEGRFEILGHDAALLVGEEYYSPPAGHPQGRDRYWEASATFGSSEAGKFGSGDDSALQRLQALRAEVAEVPARATEAYQSRLFIECIATGGEPLVPIEVPRHHVELVRAMYSSAEQHRPVTLPLDPGDPFYGPAGRLGHGGRRPQD
jgi:predicted dehydrogenase